MAYVLLSMIGGIDHNFSCGRIFGICSAVCIEHVVMYVTLTVDVQNVCTSYIRKCALIKLMLSIFVLCVNLGYLFVLTVL